MVVPTDDAGLDELARALSDLDIRLLAFLIGATTMAVDQARSHPEATGKVVLRLADVWDRQARDTQRTLTQLGIRAEGPEWEQARVMSVSRLIVGVRSYIDSNVHKTDSEMPELPIDVLREVLALAGGSK